VSVSATRSEVRSRGGPRIGVSAAVVVTLALALAAAPAALADSTQSSNWAGYAVHRSGITFTKVVGAWRQPSAACTPGTPTYSSVWVGLGGYSETSNALEQIGSEVDCSARGKLVSSAWYELVPAPSRTIRMKVQPGDELSASVIVLGHRVRLELSDLTRRTSFTRSVHASIVDVSSADWIVEAPSECSGSGSCQTLALANFGSATFNRASAALNTGRAGSISNRGWNVTRITLATSGRRFIDNAATAAAASALPSSLSAGGRSFKVTYRRSSGAVTASAARARSGALTVAALVRPRRAGHR
jgi:Peptidase A4 family